MKKKITIGLFTFFVLVSGFYGYRLFIMEPVAIETHAVYTFDIHDKNELMETSTHVFVARVIEPSGTVRSLSEKHTLYSVEVLANLKGETPKETMVRQLGGYEYDVEEARRYWISWEEEPPYEKGKTYMFFTNNNNDIEYYTAIAKYGTFPINDQNHQKELMDTYEAVYKENQGKSEDKGNN